MDLSCLLFSLNWNCRVRYGSAPVCPYPLGYRAFLSWLWLGLKEISPHESTAGGNTVPDSSHWGTSPSTCRRLSWQGVPQKWRPLPKCQAQDRDMVTCCSSTEWNHMSHLGTAGSHLSCLFCGHCVDCQSRCIHSQPFCRYQSFDVTGRDLFW